MFPITGSEPLLPRFKAEFAKHNEFLLAPVTRQDDGRLYVDVECGIIKRVVHFQNIAEVDERILQAAKELFGEVFGRAAEPDAAPDDNL